RHVLRSPTIVIHTGAILKGEENTVGRFAPPFVWRNQFTKANAFGMPKCCVSGLWNEMCILVQTKGIDMTETNVASRAYSEEFYCPGPEPLQILVVDDEQPIVDLLSSFLAEK